VFAIGQLPAILTKVSRIAAAGHNYFLLPAVTSNSNLKALL
jgi:hypothetical protein